MKALLLALALAQTAPAPPDEPSARDVRVERLPGGGFRAFQAGALVEGPDFYRAVLRPDLMARAEERSFTRRFLLVTAGAALLAGPGIGYLEAVQAGRSTQACTGSDPPVGPTCAEENVLVTRENRRLVQRGLLLGGAGGVAVGGLLAWWGLSIEPLVPTADEAEALARDARARYRPVAPPPRAGTGLRLRLVPAPGGLLIALELGR